MLTIYSKNGCPSCFEAKKLLNKNELKYVEINIDANTEAREEMIAAGHRTMPQIYKDGKVFVEGGFKGLQQWAVDNNLKI